MTDTDWIIYLVSWLASGLAVAALVMFLSS